jgi:hypothetical protein
MKKLHIIGLLKAGAENTHELLNIEHDRDPVQPGEEDSNYVRTLKREEYVMEKAIAALQIEVFKKAAKKMYAGRSG